MQMLAVLVTTAACCLSLAAAQSTFLGLSVPSFCSIYLEPWEQASATPCDPRAPAALQAMGSCLLSVDTRDVGAEEEKAAVLQYAAEDAYSKCATPITYSATPAQSFLLSALGTKSYTTQAGWQIGGPAGASILSSLDAAMTTVTVFDWETTTTTVASAPPSPSSAAPNVTVAGPRISGNASLATLAETTSKGGKGVDGWRAFGVGVLALAVALFLFLLPL